MPQSAVGATQIGQTLMVVGAGDTVEQRIVSLGDNDGAMVVVATSLKPGERVIRGQSPGFPCLAGHAQGLPA